MNEEKELKKPEKKRILELGLDIKTENEYVRHKERVLGFNQCHAEWDAYHKQALDDVKERLEKIMDLPDQYISASELDTLITELSGESDGRKDA